MAKVGMKQIEIATMLDESRDLFDFLQMKSVIELHETEQTDGISAFSTSSVVSQIDRFSDTAKTALKILNRYSPDKKGLLAPLKGLPELTFSEYEKKSDDADKILSVCHEICDCEKEITEAKAEIARNSAAKEAVEPWLPLDVPMKYQGTETTAAIIGLLPADYTAETLETALVPLTEGEGEYQCEVIFHSKERSGVFILCRKECYDKLLSALRSLGFAFPADPTKHPPRVRYERLTKRNETLTEAIRENTKNIESLASRREDIEFVNDYFSIRREKYEGLSKVSAGDSVAVFTGYVPEDRADELKAQIEEKFTAAVTVTEPAEDADVPVTFRNKPFVAAVEPITNLYSPPGREDLDPNPIMAGFYYLLFGIMLSDAGYGLLMAIGCGVAKFRFKVQGALKKTVDMYFWCGLATLFWGTLFGSWFGDIFEVVASNFFGIENLGAHLNSLLGFNLFKDGLAIWFQPVNDPMRLMRYSFLFGIIHLFAGLFACFVKMWKVGNKVGAVCDVIPVFMLVAGIVPMGAGILQVDVNPTLKTVGLYIAAAGAALVVLTAGRSSKNIVGKLGLGLYGLYNTASGWLSDILSYSRLLALGLCTGVIASVVNTLGTIPENKIVKACMLVVVFIFGHVVNMAINLIGTYVHTNRLQYVEFFAKFYEGGGRSFTPLKANTKYYKIKED